VTLTDLLPALPRAKERKHRQADTIRRLRREKRELLDRQRAASDYFARLLADRADVYAAWEDERRKRENAEQAAAAMQSERDELLEECAEWRVEAQTLSKRLAPFIAAEANANRVDVPPMQRIGADQDTAPAGIDVWTLRQAADAGLLGPVTNPGHVHTH